MQDPFHRQLCRAAALAALGLLTGGCPENGGAPAPAAPKGDVTASADGKPAPAPSGDAARVDAENGVVTAPRTGSGAGGLFGDYADADVTGKSQKGGRPRVEQPTKSYYFNQTDTKPVEKKVPQFSPYSPSPATPAPTKPKVVIPPAPKPPAQSLDELLTQLKSDDYKLRMKAASQLGAMKGEARSAVPALEAASRDKNEFVRQAADIALRQIPH